VKKLEARIRKLEAKFERTEMDDKRFKVILHKKLNIKLFNLLELSKFYGRLDFDVDEHEMVIDNAIPFIICVENERDVLKLNQEAEKVAKEIWLQIEDKLSALTVGEKVKFAGNLVNIHFGESGTMRGEFIYGIKAL
jgi:hypothetical protein